MVAVVNKRGQITIDREIREKLGVKPGMRAIQDIMNGVLVITFIPAPHRRSLIGFLPPPPRRPTGTWEEQMEEVERAIAEDAMRDG
jgi:bifunctional DNA-binding transcriptional regulator/antitoxin component of YhaV-PrlF toxin-antitoxin module